MRQFEYTFSTLVEFSADVREHAFVLRCLPRRGEGVTVLREELVVEPGLHFARQRDSFGNELAVGSARFPHDRIGYRSEGTVRIDLSQLPAAGTAKAHPLYKYPSPLASCNEDMVRWLSDLGLEPGSFLGDPKRAVGAFWRLGHAVHEFMSYESGSTSIYTSASDAFAARTGVCQDFVHIMMALLRRCGVAARYVSGLAEGQGTTHAWAQAYLGGAWRGYDPTRDQAVDEAYLPLAVGRDWSDCPVERGSFWGLVDQTQTVFMTMRECPEGEAR